MPEAPDEVGRWLWYDVTRISPDAFEQQRIAEWTWAETVQAAFDKGQKDEREEQFQRDWEAKHRQDAGKATSAEAASIERLKGRMG